MQAFVPTTCYLAWRIKIDTESSANDIREVFEWVSNCCALEIEEFAPVEAAADEAAGEGGASRANAAPGAGAGESRRDATLVTMHVRTDKIDELVNLVGELVITHTMLRQSTQGLDAIKDARAVSVFAQLERNVQDIQERVLAIRMMPVNHVFGRFPRLVRDLGLQLGKAIELKISGEQAELDKMVSGCLSTVTGEDEGFLVPFIDALEAGVWPCGRPLANLLNKSNVSVGAVKPGKAPECFRGG